MTFEQMLLFMEIANYKSFTKAAQKCYISQPNLTKLIAKMEKELGVKLFERTTQKVELTPAGEVLMARAKAHFIPLYNSIEDVRQFGSTLRHIFNIGIAQGEQLPDRLIEFFRQKNLNAPDFRLQVQSAPNPSLLPSLLQGRYDLVVTSEKDTYSDTRVQQLTLQNFQFRLAISKYHPAYTEDNFSTSALRNETIYFTPPRETATYELVENIIASLGVMAKVYPVASPTEALNNVRLCTGAAVLTGLLEEDRYPDIAFLHFEERKILPKQCLIWRANETNPYLLAILEELQALYPQKALQPQP